MCKDTSNNNTPKTENVKPEKPKPSPVRLIKESNDKPTTKIEINKKNK